MQQRFVNFGAALSSSATKETYRQFFRTGLLRLDGLVASAPDQLLVQPHGVIFNSGLVLVEDEVIAVTVPTTAGPVDYTLTYTHVDEDVIGGVPAELGLTSGLLESVPNGVVLGWVRYPGLSVPIDGTMVWAAPPNQVGATNRQVFTQVPDDGLVIAVGSDVTVSGPTNVSTTIPGSPYQLVAPVVSYRLTDGARDLRAFNVGTGAYLTRVAGAPATGEFSVDASTDTWTFNSAESGDAVILSDVTYDSRLSISTNASPSVIQQVDRIFSFPVGPEPMRSVAVEYVVLDDYTVDIIEVLDIAGTPATLVSSKVEPLGTPDGTISRAIVRLQTGQFSGTSGEIIRVLVRETVGTSGWGALLRVRVNTDDLPF